MRTTAESDALRKADPWCSCGHRESKHPRTGVMRPNPITGKDEEHRPCSIVHRDGKPCGCFNGFTLGKVLNQLGD